MPEVAVSHGLIRAKLLSDPRAVVGLLIVFLGWPAILLLPDPPFIASYNWLLAYDLFLVAGISLALMVIVRWEGIGMSSVGLRRMNRGDVLAAGAVFVLVVTIDDFFVGWLEELFEPLGLAYNLENLALDEPMWSVLIGSVVLAPIAEELAFRGYALERLRSLSGRPWLLAPMPIVVFTLLHVSFYGSATVIGTGLFAIAVTGLYLWRRSLMACVLVHMGWNGMMTALGSSNAIVSGLADLVYLVSILSIVLIPLGFFLWMLADALHRPDELYPWGTRLGWLMAFLAGTLGVLIGGPIIISLAYFFLVRRKSPALTAGLAS